MAKQTLLSQQKEHDHHRCHELLAGICEYVDGTADPKLCEEIERHLKDCENCRIVVDTLGKTVSLYRMLPEQEVPDDVNDRLLHVLKLDGSC